VLKFYLKEFAEFQLSELKSEPLETLPLSKVRFRRDSESSSNATEKSLITSPLMSLGGYKDDEIDSLEDLVELARPHYFFNESAVPIKDLSSQRWNRYAVDFFTHGQLSLIIEDNQLTGGDAWAFLKDFKMILSSIDTALRGYTDDEELQEIFSSISVTFAQKFSST